MFTIQVPSAAQQLADSLPDAAVTALMQLLGGCDVPLQQRAPVNISASFPDAPIQEITNINNQNLTNVTDVSNNQYLTQQQINQNTYNTNTALTVNNLGGTVTGPTPDSPNITVDGGFALYVGGPTYIKYLIYEYLYYSPRYGSGTPFCEKEFDVVTDIKLNVAFDPDTCQLQITQDVIKTRIRALAKCGSQSAYPPDNTPPDPSPGYPNSYPESYPSSGDSGGEQGEPGGGADYHYYYM